MCYTQCVMTIQISMIMQIEDSYGDETNATNATKLMRAIVEYLKKQLVS